MEREGVIKFNIDTATHFHPPYDVKHAQRQLVSWFTVFRKMGWLGLDPIRYGGLGYGNLSMRIGKRRADIGHRAFAITGSQTAALTSITDQHIAIVARYKVAEGQLWKMTGVNPSSESLTHAVIYDSAPQAKVCFHIHCPEIWSARSELNLPTVPSHIRYGTTEMSAAIRHLCIHEKVGFNRPIAMGGHEDGLLCFSDNPDQAFLSFIQAYRSLTG